METEILKRIFELLNMMYNKEQLETIFYELDKKLHKDATYSQLEDKNFVLTSDLEQAEETITTLREIQIGE